jgi:probable HAF family extracellular repeat protein
MMKSLLLKTELLALVMIAPPAFGQPTIIGMPGLGNPMGTTACAVSARGDFVVGYTGVWVAPIETAAWRWSSQGTVEDLGYIVESGNFDYSYDTAPGSISFDGTVAAGVSAAVYVDSDNRGFRWTPSGMQSLGPGVAHGVSGDGSIVVGSANNCCGSGPLGACRWLADGTPLVLGAPADGRDWAIPDAYAANFDGSVIAGRAGLYSGGDFLLRWVANGSEVEVLGTVPGGGTVHPTGVSADGSVIVGYGDAGVCHAFRWTQGTGVQDLGILPGGNGNTRAYGVSADGRIVVGDCYVGSASDPTGFVWTPGTGMMDFREYLLSRSVNVDGFFPTSVQGVSPDGTAVVVNSALGVDYTSSLVRGLDFGTCSADFNGDGAVGTDADIEAFFACLGGNCCPTCGSADFNGDGAIGTDADIESFFRVLGGGPC